MTIYTEDLCENGTATADYAWDGWVAANAFDNNDSTGWHHNLAAPATLQYQFTESYKIRKYTLRNRYGTNNQTPYNWLFQGSNNGSDWVTLHEVNNEEWAGIFKKEYEFTNSTDYLYYRLHITTYHPQSGGDVSIMEMEMMEEITMIPLSSIYTIGHRGNLRGKAKDGFVRSTVKQFFTSKDFTEVPK